MIIDQVTWENRGEVFGYTGLVNGTFIRQQGAEIHIGRYEDAIPNITDALFKIQHKVTCKDEQEAHTRALEACGVEGLLGILCQVPNAFRTKNGNLIEHVGQ